MRPFIAMAHTRCYFGERQTIRDVRELPTSTHFSIFSFCFFVGFSSYSYFVFVPDIIRLQMIRDGTPGLVITVPLRAGTAPIIRYLISSSIKTLYRLACFGTTYEIFQGNELI